MMTNLELKNSLIHQIAEIDDETFLTAIKTFIEATSEPTTYMTTSEQKLRISEGIEQIEKGECFTNEQVEMEFDKWLKEK